MGDNANNIPSVVGGVAAGWASYKYLPRYVKGPYGRWFLSECHDISAAEHNKYYSVAEKALADSGLKAKGVGLIKVEKSNIESVTNNSFEKVDKKIEKFINNMLDKFYDKLKVPKTDIKKFEKTPRTEKPKSNLLYILFGLGDSSKFKRSVYDVADGSNSFYHPILKDVYVNKDTMGFSTAHEMGHAFNSNSTKWLKTLSIGRHITAILASVLLAIALIKKRKPESVEEPKEVQRKKNFLKDNIGLITFGCLLPTVAEEGLASINGAKIFKPYLNPQELRKLNITNAKAWGSYLIGAAVAGILAQFAVKIKDRLAEPKETKY